MRCCAVPLRTPVHAGGCGGAADIHGILAGTGRRRLADRWFPGTRRSLRHGAFRRSPPLIHALSVWTEGEPCGDSAPWRGIVIGSGEVLGAARHGRCQCAGTAGTAARGRRHGLAWSHGVNRSGELPATSPRLFTRSRARPDCRVQAWQHSCRCRCDWRRRFDAPGWRCRRRFA